MLKALLTTLTLLILPIGAQALTKAEAMVCVAQGIDAFLSGKKISHLVDVPYMIQRENLNASEARVKQLLDQASRENVGYYRNVTANVVGVPDAKRGGFYLVAGTVKGEETKELDPVIWKKFSYQYILWARKEGDNCRIGVIAIEEVFRLAGWVKMKLN